MKCFYHPEADSLGTCKNCQRGLCRACIVECDDGLACRDRCEQAVQEMSAMILRSRRVQTQAPWARFITPAWMGVLCVLLAGLGLSRGIPGEFNFSLWLGVATLLFAAGLLVAVLIGGKGESGASR